MGAVIHPSPDPVTEFEAVYRRCFPFVWRSVVRLGVPSAELDDAVQEVFVVAYRRRADYDGRASVEAWLYGIARRVALNGRRRRARRMRLWQTYAPRGESAVDGERRAERAEASELLLRFLDDLPDPKREAFILGELEQMTGREMGAALGISPNTASARLRAARKAFRGYCDALSEPVCIKASAARDGEPEHAAQQRHWALLIAAVPQLGRGAETSVAATKVASVTAAQASVGGVATNSGWWLGVQAFAATLAIGGGGIVLVGATMPSADAETVSVASVPDANAVPRDVALATVSPVDDRSRFDVPVEPPAPGEPGADRGEALRMPDVPVAVPPRSKSTKPRLENESGRANGADDLAAETALVAEIRAAQARQAHAAALKLAQIHAQRFGDGQLGLARRRAEIASLCALGRTAEARRAHRKLKRVDGHAGVFACGETPHENSPDATSDE